MAGRKSDFTLPTNTLDELFSSQEERDEAKLSKIRDIPLEEIDDFPDHPFQVREDEDNYSPLGNNSFGTKSSDEMAAEVGESKNTIFRYIRLTELIPELLNLVDEGRIAFRPAVELSYLQKEEQSALLEQIAYADATPSLAQAIKLKRFSQDGKLNNEVIESIMSEEKPNQREKINIKYAEARRFIPASIPYEKTGEYILKALEYYHRYQERQKSRNDAR